MAISRSIAQPLRADYKSNGPFSVSLTIPAGGIGVVVVTAEHAQLGIDTSSIANPTVKDGSARIWEKRAFSCLRDGGMGYYSAIWVYDWYNATGASVSVSVSIDASAIAWNPMITYGAQVLTGVKDPSTYIPATTTTYAHQLPQVQVRPTAVGSQLVGGVTMKLNGSATETKGTFTAIAGSTIDSSMQLTSSAMLSAMVARSGVESTVAEPVTIGASAPVQPVTDSYYSLAVVEYLAAGTTGGAGTLPKRGTAGKKIAWIGDSLTYQSVDGIATGEANITAALTTVGWPSAGIWWYGVGGKQIAAPEAGSRKTTMQNIAEARAALGAEPDLWVIALVTNDLGSDDATITSAMQSVFTTLGSSAKVAWVNAGLSSLSSANEVRANNVIRTMIANRPNSYLIDWWEYAAQHDDPSSWYVDGTHMTASGYAVKNSFMADETLAAMYQFGGTTTIPPNGDGTVTPIARSTPVAADGGYKSNSPYRVTLTIPAGAVGVLACGSENAFDQTTGALVSPTVSDAGRTWVLRKSAVMDFGGQHLAGTWVYDWYNATSSSVTCTVSVDFSALAYNPMVSVIPQVLTNVKDPNSYTVQASIASTGTSSTVSLIPTAVGSQVIAAVTRRIVDGELGAVSSLSPVSGCMIDSAPSAQFIGGSNYLGAVVARSQPEATTGTPVTIGASAPAGQGYVLIGLEYLAASTSTTAVETQFRIRMNNAWQTAKSLVRVNNSWVPNVHYGIYRVADTTKPSTPTLTVDASGQTALVATFSATDNISISEYRVRIDNGTWVTRATSPYTFSGLTAGSSHTIDVMALDAAGNSSIASWAGITAAIPSVSSPDGRAYTTAVLTDSPAVYYAMQEQSGTTAADWSGNKRNGNYVAETKVDYAYNNFQFAPIALGRQIELPNITSNDNYVTGPSSAVDVSNGFTFETWVRARDNWGWGTQLFTYSDGGANAITLSRDGNNDVLNFTVSGTSLALPIFSIKTWHHVVVTVPAGGGSAKYYLDGAFVKSGAVGKLNQVSRQSLQIGGGPANGGNYFNGLMTQTALYGKELSASRIKAHYDMGQADADPVWHGPAECWDNSYYKQFTGAAPLADPSFVPICDWMPPMMYSATEVATMAPYINIAISPPQNHDYSWYRDSGIYLMPRTDQTMAGTRGSETVAYYIDDEADMAPDGLTRQQNSINLKPAGYAGFANFGTYITVGMGPGKNPSAGDFFNMPGIDIKSVDQYWYSIDTISGSGVTEQWLGITSDIIRMSCQYGYVVERARSIADSPKPLWNYIELAHPYNNTYNQGGPNPNQVEGAVWGSVIGGARGINYFHHNFNIGGQEPPLWNATTQYAAGHCVQHNGVWYYAALKPALGEVPSLTSYTWCRWIGNSVPSIGDASARHPDLPARLKKIKADLFAMAPAINSPTTPHLCHKDIYSTYRPKALDGKKYIIAVPNYTAPNGGTFSMYLPKGESPVSIEVVGEGRTITPSGGKFTDTFAAEYTHHIYRW